MVKFWNFANPRWWIESLIFLFRYFLFLGVFRVDLLFRNLLSGGFWRIAEFKFVVKILNFGKFKMADQNLKNSCII